MGIHQRDEEIEEIPRSKRNQVKKLVFFIAITLFLIFYFCGQRIYLSLITSGYQSVLLTNGQVFFGKLSVSGSWFKISDVYYLQAAEDTATSADKNANLQLVKRGSELYGPEDAMYIKKDSLLYFENMKEDSRVVQAILEEKSK